MSDYIAVQDGHHGAGDTVWWKLQGDTDRDALVAACNQLKIDRLPKLIEPETAIGRAVDSLRGRHRKVLPMRKGAWAVIEVDVDFERDRIKHWDGPTIVLDKVGRLAFTGATAEETDIVRAAFEHHLNALETIDVSSWLSEQVLRCGAISLRDGGGIYFVPPGGLVEWRTACTALAMASSKHCVYAMATVKNDAGMARAVLDGLTSEIADAVDKLGKEVISGELGIVGLNNRATMSRALLVKVNQYEDLLGDRLETLRQCIGELEVDVAAAKMAAEAKADEKATNA